MLFSSIAIAVALIGTPDSAQAEPSESELAAARTLGVEGVKLASAGKCSEAIRLLERAAELYAAPTILVPLARCQLQEGELTAAVAVLRKVLDTELPADAPKPFVDAQNEAEGLLASALPRVPRLTIKVEVLGDSPATVSVDGKAVAPSETDGISLDPGLHQVRAEAPGYLPAAKAVRLKEGDRSEVVLTLKVEPVEPAEPPPVMPPTNPDTGADQSQHDPTLTWIALGVGATGVLVGGVCGIIATQKEAQLAEDCPGGKCPRTSDADLANTKSYAIASTVGFAVGVVGLAIGGYLWFFDGTDQSAPPRAARGPRVGAFVGVSSLGLAGEF
ncbi:MAG: PEGA domain-containing protein [Polyangiaceae bacterium]|nr:PEGA domain-containing protein [Polyangiaceae bacterium]